MQAPSQLHASLEDMEQLPDHRLLSGASAFLQQLTGPLDLAQELGSFAARVTSLSALPRQRALQTLTKVHL